MSEEPAGRRKAGRARRAVGFALSPLVTIPLAAALFFVSGEQQIVPGVRGCVTARGADTKRECLERHAARIAREDGDRAAIRAIDRAAEFSGSLAASCHDALHPLGERRGARAARDGTVPKLPTGTSCRLGYYHGFFVGAIDHVRSPDDAARAARLCEEQSSRFRQLQCIHAIGHIAGGRATSTDQAARLCSATTAAVAELAAADARHECLYGLFMELALRDVKSEADDPVDPCQRLASPVSGECYRYLPTRTAMLGGGEDEMAAACARAGGDDLRECIIGYVVQQDEASACDAFERARDAQQCRKLFPRRQSFMTDLE